MGPVAGPRGMWLMGGFGARLRAIRQMWQLSLREVEERSLHFAQERGIRSHQISASWLDRLEREQHELTVNKLITLASIFGMSPEQLIGPENGQIAALSHSQSSNTDTSTEGSLEPQSWDEFSDARVPEHSPDETAFLGSDGCSLASPYRRGIIGNRDLTLSPMIPAGSLVLIDTRKRAICSHRDWTDEFQRPIYFLMTRDAYICGWCELDKSSGWLTLIPHPLSPTSSRRWKYEAEVSNIGRVVMVATRLTGDSSKPRRKTGLSRTRPPVTESILVHDPTADGFLRLS